MERVDFSGIADRWLAAFASSASADLLEKHVTREYNFLWHIFSWNLVPCLEGDAAREAFDALEYTSAIMFHFGQRRHGKFVIQNGSFVKKIRAAALDSQLDVYVTAPDFEWTYVHTHEEICGPYFCRREASLSSDQIKEQSND